MSDIKREKRTSISTVTDGSEGTVSLEVVGMEDAINYEFDIATFPQDFLVKLVTAGVRTKIATAINGLKDTTSIIEAANTAIANLKEFKLATTRTVNSFAKYSVAMQDLIKAYAITSGVDTHDAVAMGSAADYVTSLSKQQRRDLRKEKLIIIQLNNLQNARIQASLNS